MPVPSMGVVHSWSPAATTRPAVGPSRAYPSADTNNTSSAPPVRGLALRGGVDRIREVLHAAEQPGGRGKSVHRVAAAQGDHVDAGTHLLHIGVEGGDGQESGGPARAVLGSAGQDQLEDGFARGSPGGQGVRDQAPPGVEVGGGQVEGLRRAGEASQVSFEVVHPRLAVRHDDATRVEAAVPPGEAEVVGDQQGGVGGHQAAAEDGHQLRRIRTHPASLRSHDHAAEPARAEAACADLPQAGAQGVFCLNHRQRGDTQNTLPIGVSRNSTRMPARY